MTWAMLTSISATEAIFDAVGLTVIVGYLYACRRWLPENDPTMEDRQ